MSAAFRGSNCLLRSWSSLFMVVYSVRKSEGDVACGPAGRVCSARWFTECERDDGEGRVLNASVVWVAFRFPLFGVDVCMRAACRARGGAADVRSGKATLEAVAIWSRQLVGPFVRDCETERLFLCCVVRVENWRHEPVVFVVCPGGSTVVFVFCGGGEVEVVCLGDQLLRWCACEACGLGFPVISGPAGRVRSARWFTECERDGGEGRVLNASVVWVAFRLPLFGVDVCMRAACRARGGAANVRSGKAMLEAVVIWSRQLGEELLWLFRVIWCFCGVLVALSTGECCMERGRRHAVAGLSVLRGVGSPRFCVSQARECARGLSQCSGTVEVLNNPQRTTELSSFGRLKEEKTRSHLHPLREAATPTRPHHPLGTVNSVNRRVNVVNRRPLHRQRESGGVREHPRDLVTARK
ncbi:hypothetical protein Taro_001264 [Colocasia esculenta]|uniref:Uncharacterized protein n=1 Tax=Colocasia esculenta TaxID=4460 RepID=A0A843TIM5_COLES|nr:hypothetical protein [Colocasia esculenta]